MPYPYEYPFVYDQSVQGSPSPYAQSIYSRTIKSAFRAIGPMWLFAISLLRIVR